MGLNVVGNLQISKLCGLDFQDRAHAERRGHGRQEECGQKESTQHAGASSGKPSFYCPAQALLQWGSLPIWTDAIQCSPTPNKLTRQCMPGSSALHVAAKAEQASAVIPTMPMLSAQLE